MATKKYMLVRKTPKGNWKPMFTDMGAGVEREQGGLNSNRIAVQLQRDQMAKSFPKYQYAVLEVTVED